MNPMTVEEKIKAAIERHPDWDDLRIANSCSAPIAAVRAIRAGEPIPANQVLMSAQEGAGLVSLEKIIQKYDIKAAIERELATLPKGKLIEENELCRRAAGTDKQRFRRTVENNEEFFKVRRIRLKIEDGEPRWFWGSVQDIAEALKIRDL